MNTSGVITAGIVSMSLLASVGGALGQTYEWTDSGGVVHFTDNPDMVPRNYKGTMRVRESIRSDVEDQSPKRQPTQGTLTEPPKGEPLYGGKPFSWWQTRYRELTTERQAEAARLDEMKVKETAVKRKKLILQRASDRRAVKEVREEIASQEERLKSVDETIGALEADARRVGVPPRWREQP